MCDVSCVFQGYIIPLLGSLTSVFLVVSSLPYVLGIIASGQQLKRTPHPFAFMFLSNLGWIFYGVVIRNFFVLGSNMLASLFSLYYVVGITPYIRPGEERAFRMITVGGFAVMMITVPLISMCILRNDETDPFSGAGRQLSGVAADVFLTLLFLSPAQSVLESIRMRTSECINVPFAVASIMSGGFWLAYGIYLADYYVWVPNVLGLCIGIAQLACKMTIRGGKEADGGNDSA